jgi:membrane protein implicated in regulation of membrane protease activity
MDTWFVIVIAILVLFLGLGEMWLGLIGNLFRKWAGHEALQNKIEVDPPGIIGKEGTVREVKELASACAPPAAVVFVYGELWQAKASNPNIRIYPSQKVKVIQVSGMTLIVEPQA